MTHVTDWPRDLNRPFSKAMFSSRDAEKEFWIHLMICDSCKRSFQARFDDYELEEEKFWMQVQEYILDTHPAIRRIAEIIRLKARHDLIYKPTEETTNEVWEKKKEIDYHLMICSGCSRRCFDLFQRLIQFDPDVRAAHEKWYGLCTQSD